MQEGIRVLGVNSRPIQIAWLAGIYGAELMGLGRAAELLELPAFDLRLRFSRLRIPLRPGPRSMEEPEE